MGLLCKHYTHLTLHACFVILTKHRKPKESGCGQWSVTHIYMCNHHDSAGAACKAQPEIARQSAPRSGPGHKQKNIIAAVQIYCRGKVVVSNRPAYEHKSKLNMRKCHILQCYTSSNACPLPKNNHACKHQAKDRYTSSITR